ncbi:winged helix-turn-helix transcriptional regulator [Candidatus Uhrbacteria bacterium]|nr:winged helix-turn-helix transcriptional regulator [Candidatus Uhrbacteria bacterium]
MQQKELATCLRALGNERRMRAVRELATSPPLTVEAIARRIKLSYKSTARHMAVLERCGIVERARVSLEVYYRVNRQHPVLRFTLAQCKA